MHDDFAAAAATPGPVELKESPGTAIPDFPSAGIERPLANATAFAIGSGMEFRRLAALAAAKAPIVLPLDLPETPDVASAAAADCQLQVARDSLLENPKCMWGFATRRKALAG